MDIQKVHTIQGFEITYNSHMLLILNIRLMFLSGFKVDNDYFPKTVDDCFFH